MDETMSPGAEDRLSIEGGEFSDERKISKSK